MGALRFRPLCFFLSFILFLFPIFVVPVSAASGNLISTDLTDWKNLSKYDDNATELTIVNRGDIYRLTIPKASDTVYYGAVLDKTSLIAGHSYTLTFSMPTAAEISSAFDVAFSSSDLAGYIAGAQANVCIGYLNALGELNIDNSGILYSITESNYISFVGKDLKASFVAGTYTGTPCVVIALYSMNQSKHYFFFQDFCLVDNDDNSTELKGIKGFLHSIRWDLVGGQCDESDCSHSVPDYPHLSLTERMSSGFQGFFDNVSGKLGELKSSLTGLGDRISGFFSDLIENIREFFAGLGDRISGFFSDLKSSLSTWVGNIGTWLNDLGEKITSKFQEIGDKLTEFFDKFKPRVYIELEWVWGKVHITKGTIVKPVNYSVVTEEFFDYSANEEKYIIKLNRENATYQYFSIYKYDVQGNYIGSKAYSPNTYTEWFEPGYKYRFVYGFDEGLDPELANDYVLIYADEGWVNALLSSLQNFLKHCLNLIIYFDWDGNHDNPFVEVGGPLDVVSDLFNNVKIYLSDVAESITSVIDSVTAGIYIFDKFTERFSWLLGLCVFALAVLVVSRFIGL